MNNLKNNCTIKSFNIRKFILFILIGLLFVSCKKSTPLFSLLAPDKTGIHFQNSLPVNDTTFNILDYLYYFNGGGVATGDINNDGLIDIFFTSNPGSNKLYLNKGNFVFEDITEKAGVKGLSNWKTGVTMADVNGDGLVTFMFVRQAIIKSLKEEMNCT